MYCARAESAGQYVASTMPRTAIRVKAGKSHRVAPRWLSGAISTGLLLPVLRSDDNGLKGVKGILRRYRAGRHDAFVEASSSGVAIVPAGSEDERSLFLHRDVARLGGANSVVHGRQLAVRRIGSGRIGAVDCKAALPAVLVPRVAEGDGRDEVELEGLVGRNILVLVVFPAGIETVFKICHDPRARFSTVARAPNNAGSKVHRFHGAVAVVVGGRFGVAVVEAAPVDKTVLAGYHVHGLRIVTLGHPVPGLDIAASAASAIADTGLDKNAIGGMAIDRHRESRGVCRVVGSAFGTTSGRGLKVILLSGLVVDLRYFAGAPGAERVLRGGVGIAILGGPDVLGRSSARARSGNRSSFADLVEGPRVTGDNHSHRAVRRGDLVGALPKYAAWQAPGGAAPPAAAAASGTAAAASGIAATASGAAAAASSSAAAAAGAAAAGAAAAAPGAGRAPRAAGRVRPTGNGNSGERYCGDGC